MLDIKLIRENPKMVEDNLKRRNNPEILKKFKELIERDKHYRKNLKDLEDLKHERNVISESIANLKKQNRKTDELETKAKDMSNNIKILENETDKLKNEIHNLLLRIPNLLHDSVPDGKDETENVEVRKWGKPPKFDFKPRDHLTILQNLGLIDLENAAKVSGSGFYYLKGSLVLLDFSLQRFAIDFLAKRGLVVYEPPYMVNKKTYEGMIGDPLNFAEASYKIENEDLYLIPTSEYSLGSLFTDMVFNKNKLPLKLCGISPCFRKEAGTHGKYAKGLFRVHQFNKVEQFIFCLPKDSWKFHEELQKNAEDMYQVLGLHYRVVVLCSGDTPIKFAKTYDTELWMADGKFREVGSNSNATDYQARRLNIKFREKTGGAPIEFIHMLNNTAIATSRTMIAIVEQFQQKDGTVLIPKVLWSYMGGIRKLERIK